MLTDYGCPYPCSFCVMSGLGSKFRSVDNVMQELRHARTLGVREVFFASSAVRAASVGTSTRSAAANVVS